MVQKPIIHMHEVGQRIPFDVSLYRSIAFSRTHPRDLVAAREKLQHAVDVVLSPNYQVENPVTNARGRLRLEHAATPEQKVVIDQLRAIEDRLAGLESPSRPQARGRSLPSSSPYINDNYISPYMVGEIVEHAKFGIGEIVEIEGSKLTIQFSASFGLKRVVDAFVYYPAK
ncbi:hypothetical protein [Tardiphaga robiniae]|uniref:Uncharacterized protein n=1 Tax=Tardiphaga robiniae TaxID=943830 RepID=A0A163ZJL9_9BRAD|nr:hypothetical protein [Tardiphaga robiniae]KZD23553.1 hypothetical protein A4A58_27000 [Tardiphaga robiniae]